MRESKPARRSHYLKIIGTPEPKTKEQRERENENENETDGERRVRRSRCRRTGAVAVLAVAVLPVFWTSGGFLGCSFVLGVAIGSLPCSWRYLWLWWCLLLEGGGGCCIHSRDGASDLS